MTKTVIKSNINFTWKVKNYDVNSNEIVDYDVLGYEEDFIKNLKKKYTVKDEFSEALRKEMMYRYWSRAECELVIYIDTDDNVWLYPWCGCRNPEEVGIRVFSDNNFDWHEFALQAIENQVYKNEAKISVYDQLIFVWGAFVDYCWNYHHKYQRTKHKESENEHDV